MTRLSRNQAFTFAALCAGVLALYSPILKAAFVYDDLWYIVRNPFMHQPLHWNALWSDARTTAAPFSGLTRDVYRPLTTLWFWVDAHLWGPNTLPYHLENVLLHLLNGFLLYQLLVRGSKNILAPSLGAAVFLLHPVQVQTVAWITQRSALASTACVLGALLLLRETTKPVSKAGGFLLAGLALLFRETAVVLPLLYILPLLAQPHTSLSALWRNRDTRRTILALAGLSFFYLALRQQVLQQWSQMPDGTESWINNLALGVLAFPVYLGKILLPIKLRVSYAYPELHPLWIGLSAGIALIYLSVALWAEKRHPEVKTALGWIVISLLPVLQIVPIRAFVAERFLYLPMVGISFLVAYGTTGVWVRRGLMLWLLMLATFTGKAVPAWRNEQTLWANAVQQEPDNPFARLCYGDTLSDPAEAYKQYRKVLFLRHTVDQQFMAANNMSNVLLQQGEYEQALRWARKAAAQKPESPEALYNFASALEHTGHKAAAEKTIQRLEQLIGRQSPLVQRLRQNLNPGSPRP